MKEKIIGYALDDKGTVQLTADGLITLFENAIEVHGKEQFEKMMEAAGWIKITLEEKVS